MAYRNVFFILAVMAAVAGCRRNAKPEDLASARQGFRTAIVRNPHPGAGPADEPPQGIFTRVKYRSPAGELAAYVTPAPKAAGKHPAIVWAHGGFGGIGSDFWEDAPADNDQTARAFREAGIVLMIPSWRGENDNPGRYEAFFGEVDDLLAARDYVAALPYVDAERIYVGGHSTGGTMALLAIESGGAFRAAFSFGGAPEVQGYGAREMPFDANATDAKREFRLRSPLPFIGAIKRPTFYFEGEESYWAKYVPAMNAAAYAVHAPFEAFVVPGGTHFDILAPLTAMLAKKIVGDTGPSCAITVSDDEIVAARR
jgi:pimeloyl-ACP methyl ester carboxylesterase